MNFHLSDSTGLCSRAIMVFLTLAIIGTLLGACVTDNKSCSENWEKVDNLQGAIERLAAAMEKELACDLYFELPEGSFEGVMVMPGGVHLRGQGIGRTILKLPDDSEDGVVLKLEPGEQKTCSVESLQIDANDGVGIYAEGAGTVELSKLRVNVEGSARGGVAFRLKDIPDFTMLQSSAGGNVNKSNVGVINPSSVEMFAATGLLIEDCRKGELQDVSVEGFAHQGARLSGSGNISWKSSDTGSVISDCVRVGIVATDGVRLEMQSIDFRNIWMGGFNNSGVGLLASESEISGKEMTFSNCDLVGALAHNSQITLDDVVLQDSFFGFWAQKDDDSSPLANIHLSGIKAVNLRGVAIGAYGVDDFLISDSTIQDVAKASLPWEGGSKQIGRASCRERV